jgi:UDP-GlcNAc:undecaprenyl-phosphate/decaprenyl-phosphate GlcNAc-1-phosphate transferase
LKPEHAFLVGSVAAFSVSLTGTPVARRLAVRFRVLDLPRDGKSHLIATPYFGGLAILAGIVLSTWLTGAWRALGGLLVAVVLLSLVGLLDDANSLTTSARLGVQTLAAGVALASGVLASPTGLALFDSALTIVWLVGITNAFNLLDNMNGLSAGAALVGAIAFLFLAAAQGQFLVAALAASIVGACLGFLPHNYPRARIFMGDAGSTLLGFLLAVLALKVEFPLEQPWSFGVPICVLGLAVLDTSVVVIDRARSRRPIAIGSTDHLSHRLVSLGLTPTASVAALILLASAFGTTGILVGRSIAHPYTLLLVAAALVSLLFTFLRVPWQGKDSRRRLVGIAGTPANDEEA